ncbi:hypothetical protein OBBRIDRAFT_801332 [Obba rivulosa]|uniref:Uncharacterized protein n=1 Tax=Obba rivulosa TaxID=1052685 RepID=A0A8E2DRC5_9APHY|nr:hypothetical protein OBBRIDRAFT_801332 [Obba rivulosa]
MITDEDYNQQPSVGGVARDSMAGNVHYEREDRESAGEAKLSRNIRGDLENILGSSGSSSSSFSYHGIYADAPNPVLDIDGPGLIGLPLNTREAEVLKAAAEQAPFGKGERTVVDKNVRDTWQIDAKKISFGNTAWQDWLNHVVRQVCVTLQVNIALSAPKCELYKLLLYETGSHWHLTLTTSSSEKADGMFATMVVVLPSLFTGGAVRVSHGSVSETYDSAQSSRTSTSVLAWYTDVKHEVQTITSGYRLALSFNLVHTTTALRPALRPARSTHINTADRLEHVLLSWKHIGREAPRKIVYLLSHKYTTANLCGSALKGEDAQAVAMLNPLAKKHGFKLGLATVKCYVTGTAYEEYGYYGRGPLALEIADETDSSLSIENLVNLDGNDIVEKVDYEPGDEAIPENLKCAIEAGECDNEDCEVTGNRARVTLVQEGYYVTVLIIWPNRNHYEILYRTRALEKACTKLRNSASSAATVKEGELIEYVLGHRRPSDQQETLAIRCLCAAAVRWRDYALWDRIIKECKFTNSLDIFGKDAILRALDILGFSTIVQSIERLVQRDSCNTARFQLLDEVEKWATSGNSPELKTSVEEWLTLQREFLFQTLHKPRKGEAKFLISLATKYGGMTFLQSPILVQIKDSGKPTFMIEFAEELLRITPSERVELETRNAIVKELIATGVSTVNFWKPLKHPLPLEDPNWSRSNGRRNDEKLMKQQISRVKRYSDICTATSDKDHLGRIFEKLLDSSGVTPETLMKRVEEVIIPFLPSIYATLREQFAPHQVANLSRLCQTIVDYGVSQLTGITRNASKEEVRAMMQAILLHEDSKHLFESTLQNIEANASKPEAIRIYVETCHELREELSIAASKEPGLRATIARLASKYAENVDLPKFDHGKRGVIMLVDILDFCLRLGCLDAYNRVTGRVLNHPHLDTKGISDYLGPFIPKLRELILKHGGHPSSPTFAPVFRTIMSMWTQKILGPKPANADPELAEISRWSCSCDVCKEVRKFLTSEPERENSWRYIGAVKRKHVEKHLASHAQSAAVWSTVETSPQGLKVSKHDSVYHSVLWAANQKTGLELLKMISNDTNELKTVLGNEYVTILDCLNGRTAIATTSTVALASSGSATAVRISEPAVGGSVASQASGAPIENTGSENLEPPRKRKKIAYDEKDSASLIKTGKKGRRLPLGSTGKYTDEDILDKVEDVDQLGSEEEGEDIISNPSEDIKGDLGNILTDDLGTGSFSVQCFYDDAPNPALEIDGLGLVGLPLSTRDAIAIKQCAEQAPFGMGARTVVDKTVRDTWEIDAKEACAFAYLQDLIAHFTNPAWDAFLQRAVREVCSALGVDYASSAPRCEPYKLLLYETGSHSEKADGMFATMIVMLPSPFTGGTVNVSHGPTSAIYDCAARSRLSTSVLAWYTDVKHEVQKITSGYRLALSFNLIHTTDSLRPVLKAQTDKAERLRHILLSWKQTLDDAPPKILFLLDHKYSKANLRGSALEEQHGFHLGLAIAECHVTATAEEDYDDYDDYDDYGWGGRRRCRENIEMGEEIESHMTIGHLVDLQGHLIAKTLTWDDDNEVIPTNLEETLKDGDHDRQEYEGYTGNAGATIDRWYRAAVLVIWPDENKHDIMFGPEGLAYACQRVSKSTSTTATAEEQELLNYVLEHQDTHSPKFEALVVQNVCTAATRWRNLDLWARVFKLWGGWQGIEKIGQATILKALDTFGFDNMRWCISGALESNLSNPARSGFLDAVEEWVINQGSPELVNSSGGFLAELRDSFIQTLKPPGQGEAPFLLSLASKFGGMKFLQSPMLVQIQDRGSPSFMIEFAEELLRTRSDEQSDVVIRDAIIRDLLATAISKIDFYQPPALEKPQDRSNLYSHLHSAAYLSAQAQAQVTRAKQCIDICLATKNEYLIEPIILKLTKLQNEPADVAQKRAKDVLLPLLSFLTEQTQPLPTDRPIPMLGTLCSTIVEYNLHAITRNPSSLVQTEISTLMKALVAIGQPQVIITATSFSVVPKLEPLALNASGQRAVLEELLAHRKGFPSSDDVNAGINAVIRRFAKKYASAVPLPFSRRALYGVYHREEPGSTTVVDALDFCLRASCTEAYLIIINRAANPSSPAKLDATYIQGNLVPLIPELRKLATKYKSKASLSAFTSTVRTIMLLWARKVLGQKPVDASAKLASIKNWTCSCEICTPVRLFLVSEPERSKNWHRIGAPTRRHVEKFLATYTPSVATWSTITGSPQGITVTKTDAVYHPIRWLAEQKKGLELLKKISGDAKELQMILGDDYVKIVDLLNGRPESAATNAVAPSTSHAASTLVTAGIGQEPPKKRTKLAYD